MKASSLTSSVRSKCGVRLSLRIGPLGPGAGLRLLVADGFDLGQRGLGVVAVEGRQGGGQRRRMRRQIGPHRRARDHGRVAHTRQGAQGVLDLLELDAVAADLDLLIGAAEEVEPAVSRPGAPGRLWRTRARWRPGSATGTTTKRSAVRSGRLR